MAIADGCNWGKEAAKAAQIAVTQWISTIKTVTMNNLQDVCKIALR